MASPKGNSRGYRHVATILVEECFSGEVHWQRFQATGHKLTSTRVGGESLYIGKRWAIGRVSL